MIFFYSRAKGLAAFTHSLLSLIPVDSTLPVYPNKRASPPKPYTTLIINIFTIHTFLPSSCIPLQLISIAWQDLHGS